jgi:cytosine/adenosine deaminase-related metal-dependent hydrolase
LNNAPTGGKLPPQQPEPPMPQTLVLRGRHMLTDPRRKASGLIKDGAVAIAGGVVTDTGTFADIRARHPDARVLGDGTQLLLPGLVDAHGHGRGLTPIQKGTGTDFLENALFDWAYGASLPPELTAGLTAWRHLRSGCTTMHHNGFDDDGLAGAKRARTAIRTYLDSGIRLAFSPGLRDESKLVMGGESFLDTLPADLAALARPFVAFDRDALMDDYFALFEELHAAYHGAETRVLLAPCWAHGASEDFLRRVRDASDSHGGALVHMHLLQTPVQKAWGLRRNGKPTVQWLDELGLMDRRMAFGHAIWVTRDDIDLMGARQVSVTTHPSCNFHMRNGITPVMPMRAAGVNVAMGMDDKTINDDEDAVMELRMLHKMHRVDTFDLRSPSMDAYEALETATLNAARASGFENEVGALLPGWKGDAILVGRAYRCGRRAGLRGRPRCHVDGRARAVRGGAGGLRTRPVAGAPGAGRPAVADQALHAGLVRGVGERDGRCAVLPGEQPGLRGFMPGAGSVADLARAVQGGH